MPKDEPNTLITSESKRVRVWDLRQSIERGSAQVIENPEVHMLPSKAYSINEKKHNNQMAITKSFKMKYQPNCKRLIAHFQGARGLFTFDLRKGRQIDYYDFHQYPMTDFDLGTDALANTAVTCGAT